MSSQKPHENPSEGPTSPDGIIRLSGGFTWQEALTLEGHEGGVNSVAFSPDGKRIVSSGQDGTIKVWQTTMAPASSPATRGVLAK